MQGRKERREKWLKGEVPRPGLSLEDREAEKFKEMEEHESEKSNRLSGVVVSTHPVHSHGPSSAANEV